jgi:hypothetical protein
MGTWPVGELDLPAFSKTIPGTQIIILFEI